MDQNNLVLFIYKRGFIQPEMGILWLIIPGHGKFWNSIFDNLRMLPEKYHDVGGFLYKKLGHANLFHNWKNNIDMGIMLPV